MTRRFVGPLVLMVGLILAGCTGSPDDEPQPTVSDALHDKGPAEQVELEAERPAGAQDAAAVSAALWRTDPCALLPNDTDPTRIERDSPHVCSIDYEDHAVSVKVGSFFGEGEKADYEPITIADGRAYEIGTDRNKTLCYLWIPVSPTASIFIQDIDYGIGKVSCRLSKRIAAHAIDRIGAGKTGTPPAKGVKPPCQALRAALSDKLGDRRLVVGGHRTSIDSCSAVSAESPNPHSNFEPPAYALLEVSNDSSIDGAASLRVRGHEVRRRIFVWESTNSRRCEMEWSGRAGFVTVTTRSCPLTQKTMQKVIPQYEQPASNQPGEARLRAYRQGESDLDAVGACDAYVSSWLVPGDGLDASLLPAAPGCRTYETVELPPEPAEILHDAHVDPRVTCELAREAMNAHDESATPVVLTDVPEEIARPYGVKSRPCAFVDSRTDRQYLVVASADPPPGPLVRRSLYRGDDEADDRRFTPDPKKNWDFGTSTQTFGHADGDQGYLTVMVSEVTRFDDIESSSFVTPEQSETAEEILDAIIDEHFKEAQ
ncbi:hypothetical protein MU582_03280 [Nocardioidaceae bacterium SCSIO 66511]|nr:hypothetical protein MU582_03280 [Nocardioidaceae bacterium SCSIO 66511]